MVQKKKPAIVPAEDSTGPREAKTPPLSITTSVEKDPTSQPSSQSRPETFYIRNGWFVLNAFLLFMFAKALIDHNWILSASLGIAISVLVAAYLYLVTRSD
jgi:hypothetical protein